MKQLSWMVVAVVAFLVGFFLRGSLDGRGAARPAPPAAAVAAQPPRPRPVEDPRAVYRIPVDGAPQKGPADALVTIVESSDFECPFCKRAAPTMAQLEKAFAGKIRFAFVQNPLAFHPRAMPAAIVAEEARAQGGDEKFWAMHDRLFEMAPELDEARMLAAAKELGLDPAKIKAALDSGTHRERIERDQRMVVALGAPATPTFFINGRKLAGARPFEEFRAVAEEELKKAEAMVAAGTPAAQVYARLMEKAASAPVYQPGTEPQPGAPAAPAAPPAPPPAQMRKVTFRPDDPSRGPKEAKLTIVLFSDFQCPFCARVEPSLKQLEEAFPGQVRVLWKHQPLPFHQHAMPAALAAEAAREQGKFWQLHERLFANQQALDDASMAGYARDAGLDAARFQAAVAARRGAGRIAEDQAQAGAVGANGTPTMFFNCRQVVGAQPFEQLRAVAEDEIRKADALLAGRKPDAGFYDRACDANVAAAPRPQPVRAEAQLPPGPVDVPIRPDDPVRGNPKAPVTIALFSDFQCPFCARVEPTLAQARQEYGEKLRIVWKHQPLSFHPNALPAAEAAEAAREQGKFWEFHDKLFASQAQLSPDTIQRVAREVGLDMRRFDESIKSGRARARIAEDQNLAMRVGASGTPTMFVNGERIVGAVPYEQVKPVIDRKLAAR